MDPIVDPKREAHTSLNDRFGHNPYLHFVISEAYAALSAGAVHVISRAAAYVIAWFDEKFPIPDPRPYQFFETVMLWGGMFATAATFLVITYYQLLVLMKRLSGESAK